MTLSTRATVGVAALLLVLSSVPVAIGYLIEPDGRRFMGIVSDVPDWAQYHAWMKAFATRAVIDNPLTCEPQQPAFFNLQWFALGRASTWVPRPLVLEVFRLGTAALFLWVTLRVCRAYFAGAAAPTWLAWLLINASAGLGWLLVLKKRLTGLRDVEYPLDVYIAEPISFQNMIIFPHFLVAAVLLLLIFRTAAVALDRHDLRYAGLSAGFAIVLGMTHGYDLILVYGVLGAFALCIVWRDGFRWFPLLVLGGIAVAAAPPPAYFAYLTTADPTWRQVLSQFGAAGVYTPSPPHLLILVGLPLFLTLASLPTLWSPADRSHWTLLVRVWCVVNFPLLYIPADFQVHMLNGWQIPLGILASEGVFSRLLPWLSRHGTWSAYVRDPKWAALSLCVVVMIPTNVYLLAWRVREVLRRDHDHFLFTDELGALQWLAQQAPPTDTVLASLTLGQHIPGQSGHRVHAAHWAMTAHFERKRAEVAAFFHAETDAARRLAILRWCPARYVIHGRGERALGGFDPHGAPYLTWAYTSGETQVFRVESDQRP